MGPSWGWLHAAFSVTRNLWNNLTHLRQVRTKIFIATAGDDRVLDTTFDATVASTLSSGAHRVYPDAWHSILHDTPDMRREYLADIHAFLRDHHHFISTHRPISPIRKGWLLGLGSFIGL
jgi:alpha-beta hydrolase superfamily lysophospholipase